MTPIVIKYPLDLTGKSPNNLVLGEIHDLPAGVNRAIATNYGPFYTQKLVVRELPSGKVLTPNVQYKAVQLYEEATMRSGLEVCAILVITDTAVANKVELDYQVVGGEFSSSVAAIQQLIESLDLDSRPVTWAEVLGKPSAFPPSEHLHDVGDLYGFEYVVAALEAIRQAILQGDEATHDELRRYADKLSSDQDAKLAQLKAAVDAHINNVNNPHQTTKAQVGLGSVENLPLATQALAEAGQSNQHYMTPLSVAQAITKQVLVPLNAHIARTDNPHAVTKTQVGLSNLTNDKQVVNTSGNALKLAWDGTQVILTVDTTSMGRVFTTSQPDPNLTNHIANRSNPHGTTAGQVGAYTQAETNSLLNQRLPTGGTAVNANLLQGLAPSQFIQKNQWNGDAQGTVLMSTLPNNIGNISNAGNDANAALRISNGGNQAASAVISFVREGSCGAHFGLDTDNQLRFGGWSFGTAAWKIWHEGNFNPNNFGAKNTLTGSYWIDVDTGFIIQWGSFQTPDINDWTSDDLYFPIAFPRACFMCIGNKIAGGLNQTSDGNCAGAFATSRATFRIFNDDYIYRSIPVGWIAIGY